MTTEDVVQKTIEALWLSTNRRGVEALVEFLRVSDFFRAPCSTHHHLARPGGLAEHSYNVYSLLCRSVAGHGLDIPHETVVVCGLGHDLCKVHHYREEAKDGQRVYVVRDNLPLGHGEQSLSVLQEFLDLEDVEKMAIRWHMGPFDMSVHFNNREAFNEATKRTPLVPLLFIADYEASAVAEGEGVTT